MTFWIPLVIMLILCSIFFTYLWQRSRRRRELDLLSEAIERMVQRRDAGHASGKDDASGYSGTSEREKSPELEKTLGQSGTFEQAGMPRRGKNSGKRVAFAVKKQRRIYRGDTHFSRVCHKLGRMEQSTKACYEQVAAERDLMRETVSELARQLRAPLTNLEVYLDFLEKSELAQPGQVRYVEAVRASEQRLHVLVENFMKMSELENRTIRMVREEWDLLSTLEAAVKRLEPVMREKRIVLKRSLPGKLYFPHDAQWFGEAVYQVLDNAVKYGNEGEDVELCARRNGMFTQIWVVDHGIGIEEGEETEIFRRFYRAENAREQEGFGLGLTIAREIVLQHGGFMRSTRLEDGVRVEIQMENP